MTFLIIVPYKYYYLRAYLLTDEFPVGSFYGSSMKNMSEVKFLLQFLLESLVCYKDTQMKAYDITKVRAELKNSDSVRYRNRKQKNILMKN